MSRSVVVVVVILASLAGCYAAPPMGLGTGAHALPGDRATVVAAAGTGGASGRDTFQIDGGINHSISRRFSVEFAAAYTQLSVRTDDGRSARGFGLIPYVRPRWQLGRVSLTFGGSVFGAAGGEVGTFGALLDAQVGVGGAAWSVYAGGYGMAYSENVAFDVSTLAAQARIGGELLAKLDGLRVGLALEVYRQTESLTHRPEPAMGASFFAVGVKLRVEADRAAPARRSKRETRTADRSE